MNRVQDICNQFVELQWMTEDEGLAATAEWRLATPAGKQSGDALLDWLVRRRTLTDFQAKTLRDGLPDPLRLGPYRLLAPITAGRLGILYHAVQEERGESVCLKLFPAVLDDGREWLRRMERELQFSAALDHPNVVRTFGIEQAEGNWYLVMEDLDGETLQDRLDREGRLPYRTACQLIGDAALGLAHLHDKFVVHRDVQPANLWITADHQRVKVMELGAIRNALSALRGAEDSSVTQFGTVLGVYDYMAPEQADDAHSADHRSDIYALGCTLYMVIPLTPPPPTSSIRAWRTIRGQSWNWRSDSIRKRSVERICSSFGGRRDFFVRVARTAAVGLRREAGSSATVVVTKRRPLRERSFRTRISPCGCGFGPFGT